MEKNNLKLIRTSHGETQKQLADALGVSIVTVAFWESGARTPSVGMLVALAVHYGCSADELLGLKAVVQ